MANLVYNKLISIMLNKEIDFDADNIKAALLNSYAPNVDHEFFNEISSTEVTANGYTQGGILLQNKSIANNKFDADDISWTIVGTMTATHLVIYNDTGDPATSQLICLIDLNGSKVTTDGTFTLEFSPNGIFNIAQA